MLLSGTKEAVKEKHGPAALRVAVGEQAGFRSPRSQTMTPRILSEWGPLSFQRTRFTNFFSVLKARV